MKRLTVSLPDDLVERIRQAAGGEGQVSSYVARALADFTERESLDEVLAAWAAETPVDEETRRQVAAEHDLIGLTGAGDADREAAG
jgi:predicted transcriptional regulator